VDNKNSDIDLVIELNDKIVPVELKYNTILLEYPNLKIKAHKICVLLRYKKG
jgi:hypothetical protein